jgi:(4-(4-[2-(gamma-L-glutamylamino)ethyl]phenoxymethyl)furan-2-yl)methanamine synthase
VSSRNVIGWDIGGVNTKVARVSGRDVQAVRERHFELQHAPLTLAAVLRALATDVVAAPDSPHAVTMTAELSQMFRTKRDGVHFVLDAVEAAFPGSALFVYGVDGRFRQPVEARREPYAVAAANWSATARSVAGHHPTALILDVGTTTTDIIPVVDGELVARGRTDPERLASGELVYTGALRTPAEAIAHQVPFGNRLAETSAEGFAIAGDVHLWRGDLTGADYTAPTPDGRPASREFAGERLARVVCADREILDEEGVSAIADALAEAQVARISDAIRRVLSGHPSIDTAVVTGLGAFIATRAANRVGLRVVALATDLGGGSAQCAPACSVALLLEQMLARATTY